MTPTSTVPATIAVADWPEALVDVLERQHVLVENLAALSQTQASLIADRHSDRLLELLSRRQSIIDEFTVCQTQMSVLSQNLDRRLAQVSGPQRQRIRALIAGISDGLRTVMQRDQEDQQALHQGRSALVAEISGLDAGRQARSAYGPVGAGASRFADREV
jgi:hypothetical protein